eukprot:6214837-Pleurochrysis_carterae.AAC.5
MEPLESSISFVEKCQKHGRLRYEAPAAEYCAHTVCHGILCVLYFILDCSSQLGPRSCWRALAASGPRRAARQPLLHSSALAFSSATIALKHAPHRCAATRSATTIAVHRTGVSQGRGSQSRFSLANLVVSHLASFDEVALKGLCAETALGFAAVVAHVVEYHELVPIHGILAAVAVRLNIFVGHLKAGASNGPQTRTCAGCIPIQVSGARAHARAPERYLGAA